MSELLSNIWAVYLDTAFWLLLGLVAAGMVKAYIPEDAMQRWLGGRGLKAVTKAALFGAPLPLCSCGVLPAAIGVRRSGASREATVSFLISTPETSIDSVTVTYALMGPVMAVYRPLAAVFSAIVTGMMTSLVKDDEVIRSSAPVSCSSTKSSSAGTSSGCCSSDEASSASACCAETRAPTLSKPLQVLRYAGAELLDDIAKWMFIGILAAGVIATLIPPGWLAEWGQGLMAMLVMLLVGIPMYICAVASTPIAAGLLLSGVSPGTVLVFLLVGPATNIGGIMLLRKELGQRVTAIYLLGMALTSIAGGLLLDSLLMAADFTIDVKMGEAHEMLPAALVWSSALLLLVLAIRPVRRVLLPFLDASTAEPGPIVLKRSP